MKRRIRRRTKKGNRRRRRWHGRADAQQEIRAPPPLHGGPPEPQDPRRRDARVRICELRAIQPHAFPQLFSVKAHLGHPDIQPETLPTQADPPSYFSYWGSAPWPAVADGHEVHADS